MTQHWLRDLKPRLNIVECLLRVCIYVYKYTYIHVRTPVSYIFATVLWLVVLFHTLLYMLVPGTLPCMVAPVITVDGCEYVNDDMKC